MKTKVETTVDRGQTTVDGLMAKLLKDNKEGGTIFLSDFMAQLPGNTEKSNVIQALKGNKEGIFIPGRHGRPSRWVYGPMRAEVSQAEQKEAAEAPSQPSERRGRPRGSSNKKDMVDIQITIGNQVATVSFNKLDLMADVLSA